MVRDAPGQRLGWEVRTAVPKATATTMHHPQYAVTRSELYDAMLEGWSRHTFDLPNNAAGGEEKRRMTEVVWCNFAPDPRLSLC